MSSVVLKASKALLGAAAILVFLGSVWIIAGLYAPLEAPADGVFFEVEKGKGAGAVARALARQGILRSSWPFRLGYSLFYFPESLKAGEYRWVPPLKTKDVLDDLVRGRIFLVPLTIPEGLMGREVGDLLLSLGSPAGEGFAAAFRDPGPIASWDPRARDLEGYLYPDTYLLPRKTTAPEIVQAMTGQFKKVFNEDWRRRAADLGLTVRAAVTLASLIEEEASLPGERRLVSAVFHNRLRIGMKLDCDPTIVYALKIKGTYTGRLLVRDLQFPSPYNTYLHSGLPPGPICSPGRESLEAALYPASGDLLYFVSRNDGSHQFSRTFEEHQNAVRRYRLDRLKKK